MERHRLTFMEFLKRATHGLKALYTVLRGGSVVYNTGLSGDLTLSRSTDQPSFVHEIVAGPEDEVVRFDRHHPTTGPTATPTTHLSDAVLERPIFITGPRDT